MMSIEFVNLYEEKSKPFLFIYLDLHIFATYFHNHKSKFSPKKLFNRKVSIQILDKCINMLVDVLSSVNSLKLCYEYV